MNKKQKIVLWIGVIIFCAIAILPLEKPNISPVSTIVREADKGRIVVPPKKVYYRRIRPPKLYVYWIMTTAVTGALIISLKESK